MKFNELTSKFGLEANTLDFIGHAVALYTDNSYINAPALEVIEKMQLYMDSVGRFGDGPFIYPVYGLSGIPESFSRKSLNDVVKIGSYFNCIFFTHHRYSFFFNAAHGLN